MISILPFKIISRIYKLVFIASLLVAPSISYSQKSTEVEDILVVGSRISNAKLTKILPITIITSKEIELLGIDSGDDLIGSLVEQGTNKFNDAGNAIAGVNSARGDMGAFNLRNLGTGNTLVLLNGRRLINSPSFQSESVGGSFVPVNSVNSNILCLSDVIFLALCGITASQPPHSPLLICSTDKLLPLPFSSEKHQNLGQI